jgi:hypothetical protein
LTVRISFQEHVSHYLFDEVKLLKRRRDCLLPLLIPVGIKNEGKDTAGVIFWTDVGHLVEREARTE